MMVLFGASGAAPSSLRGADPGTLLLAKGEVVRVAGPPAASPVRRAVRAAGIVEGENHT
jgi:hypothetical protein